LRDFAWLDLENFLKQQLNVDFANFGIHNFFLNATKIPFSHEEIIELVKPAITIQMKRAKPHYFFSISSLKIQSNRCIIIDSPALLNLIKLITWKACIAAQNWQNDPTLANKFSAYFSERNALFRTICLKNLSFEGLYLDQIVHNAKSISFKNSIITISDNDINALKTVQKRNITKPAPGPLDFYGPYCYYSNGSADYEKHSLEVDFGFSIINNPNKLLDLVDIHNGYFQTISIKNALISFVALKRKQFLCRKLARVKFFLSVVLNHLVIIITLFKYNRWILGTLGAILSSFIQYYIHYRMIEFPEKTASHILKKSFNTNGGVTFKVD